jgi:hypothetical protein
VIVVIVMLVDDGVPWVLAKEEDFDRWGSIGGIVGVLCGVVYKE